MKTEVEARLLEINVQNFKDKLEKANAEFIGDWLQLRYCYDFSPVNPNSWIRLRTNGKVTTLTIKDVTSKKIDGTRESEIEVSDFAVTDEILNKMGYFARSKQENRRIQYKLDGVEIDIDFWPLIPTYAEFEAGNEEQIKKVCEKLGIEFNDLTSLDVSSIYEQYGYNINNTPMLELEEERQR